MKFLDFNFLKEFISVFCRFLIGSPKSRQPTDKSIGTAPYLKPQYDEQYASGTLHSCPLEFNSQRTTCSPARPSIPNNPKKLNNRDALGSSIVGNNDDPNIAVIKFSLFVLKQQHVLNPVVLKLVNKWAKGL